MSDNFNNDVNLVFETDDMPLSFTGNDIKMFPRISMTDSIYSFYPQVEISYNDSDGSVIDRYAYVEGLKFLIQLGSSDRGYVGGDFMWAKNSFIEAQINPQLSGVNLFVLMSYYFRYNHRNSRAWKGTCSSVAETICRDVFQIIDSSLYSNIEKTTGIDWRYQCNETMSVMLDHMTSESVSAGGSNSESPFFTFFNLNGEFYFCSLDYMLKQTSINPGDPYKFVYSKEYGSDPRSILDYEIDFMGTDDSFHHYKKKFGKLQSSGTVTEQIEKIESHVTKKSDERYLVRKKDVDHTMYEWLGIEDKYLDVKNLEGKLNYTYRNSLLVYRMTILIQFNSEAVTGKTIELAIDSFDENKGRKLKMLSGKWLITKASHFTDPDYIITTELEISRPALSISQSHPFYTDFL